MENLADYKDKRNFNDTPEPEGQSAGNTEEKNRFVIQRHMARREHYDFSLQLDDALISWAIPKKPVHDPEIKRLAIKVEDHPLDYIHFEGNIPKGNYGAGTVMVWDLGYYYLDDKRIFPSAREMKKRIAKGSLKLYLQGAKIKGYFNLVKSNGSQKDEWFFIKAGEGPGENHYEERSALTGRSMEEINASEAAWQSDKPRKQEEQKGSKEFRGYLTRITEKQDFPGFIEPMKATLADKAFSRADWIYEMKFDGYRIIAAKNNDDLRMYSRNGNDLTHRFPLVNCELSEINAAYVIDGEVCYMENADKSNFQKLKHSLRTSEQDRVHFYVFDILWLNGHDLKDLPLTERKKLLAALLTTVSRQAHYLEHIENYGEKFYAEVENQQLEGIIAKRSDGKYYPGSRSDGWLKIKTGHRQEMIICGYMPSGKESREFSSLLCAVHQDGELIYTGRVGTGFSESVQKQIIVKLNKIRSKNIPVSNPPDEKNNQWLKPLHICEVKFSGWTQDRIMRHASFIGLRTDKQPEEIKIEKATISLESVV